MTPSPIRITIFLFTYLISVFCLGQNKKVFSKKQECFSIFLQAHKTLIEEKDTTGHHNIFKKIDSIVLSENSHEYFVKYRALRGTILCMNGFPNGIKYNLEAVEYGRDHLDSLSKFLANAYGNLGVSHHLNGNTDEFIRNTTLSNNILIKEPKKNAASIMQTNFNFEVYFVDDPEGFKFYAEQNDSLVNYLKDEDFDVKALYYIKESIKNIEDQKLQEAKKLIALAFKYYNEDTQIKPNIVKSYYRALATYYFLTKDYLNSIANFKLYYETIKSRNSYTANTFLFNQIAQSYKALNQTDSAIIYSKIAYDNAVLANQHKKGSYNKYNLPNQCIELLKFQKTVSKNYDKDVFEVLKDHSDNLITQPVKYLEFLKIQDEIDPESNKYISYLNERIKEDNLPTIRAYYYKKYGQFYYEQRDYDRADSLFNLSVFHNKVNQHNPNTTFHNYNLLKEVTLEKHKIFSLNKPYFSEQNILNHYEKTLKNLISYVYENWDGIDKKSTLNIITKISNEAVDYCYQNQNSATDIPFAKYGLYFSDQGNSILYKYNKRRIESLNKSNISRKESERLGVLRKRIDDFLYNQNINFSQSDLVLIQNEYNGLLLKAETEDKAFIELQNFENFDKHITNLGKNYDCILAIHATNQSVYKITEEIGFYKIHKLNDSLNALKENQENVIKSLKNSDQKSFSKYSYELFTKLFEHKADLKDKHILIVNSPKLVTFPFECLIDNPGLETDNFKTLSYLIHKTEFVYASGLSSDYKHEENTELNQQYVGIYSEYPPYNKKIQKGECQKRG